MDDLRSTQLGNPVGDTLTAREREIPELISQGNKNIAPMLTMISQATESRLRQLEADLAHKNRLSMMGELAASLAHEIMQPIAATRTSAVAALNFLARSQPDIGEVSEALACIVDAAKRAGDIIDRIRDQIKKTPPRKESFDLNEAINEVIGFARGAIINNRVSVRTRLAEGSLAVHGDRVQLQQVLLNLILNAVEAMGSVEAGPRELSLSTEEDDTGVLVAVRDSGPGIDAAQLERVFEAFYTTKSGGTGMGLSICRSIIDAHQGKLWAEANNERGAVFQFTLPARKVPDAANATRRGSTDRAVRPCLLPVKGDRGPTIPSPTYRGGSDTLPSLMPRPNEHDWAIKPRVQRATGTEGAISWIA
jgi:C4-dicarboxylate-specific signal transduction histidine kinase